MMCSKVIYTGLIKTEIGNWNSDGGFFPSSLCNMRKILVESPGKIWLKNQSVSGITGEEVE